MRKFVTSAALAVAVAGVAGCGGGGSQDTPTDTAKAFLDAVKSNNATDVCKYLHFSDSSTSSKCVDQLNQAYAKVGKFSGNASVGNSATSGNQALVVTVGSFTFLGTSISNSDKNAGLPSNGESFAQAYGAAADDPKSPDLTLQKIGDKWFVVTH